MFWIGSLKPGGVLLNLVIVSADNGLAIIWTNTDLFQLVS